MGKKDKTGRWEKGKLGGNRIRKWECGVRKLENEKQREGHEGEKMENCEVWRSKIRRFFGGVRSGERFETGPLE